MRASAMDKASIMKSVQSTSRKRKLETESTATECPQTGLTSKEEEVYRIIGSVRGAFDNQVKKSKFTAASKSTSSQSCDPTDLQKKLMNAKIKVYDINEELKAEKEEKRELNAKLKKISAELKQYAFRVEELEQQNATQVLDSSLTLVAQQTKLEESERRVRQLLLENEALTVENKLVEVDIARLTAKNRHSITVHRQEIELERTKHETDHQAALTEAAFHRDAFHKAKALSSKIMIKAADYKAARDALLLEKEQWKEELERKTSTFLETNRLLTTQTEALAKAENERKDAEIRCLQLELELSESSKATSLPILNNSSESTNSTVATNSAQPIYKSVYIAKLKKSTRRSTIEKLVQQYATPLAVTPLPQSLTHQAFKIDFSDDLSAARVVNGLDKVVVDNLNIVCKRYWEPVPDEQVFVAPLPLYSGTVQELEEKFWTYGDVKKIQKLEGEDTIFCVSYYRAEDANYAALNMPSGNLYQILCSKELNQVHEDLKNKHAHKPKVILQDPLLVENNSSPARAASGTNNTGRYYNKSEDATSSSSGRFTHHARTVVACPSPTGKATDSEERERKNKWIAARKSRRQLYTLSPNRAISRRFDRAEPAAQRSNGDTTLRERSRERSDRDYDRSMDRDQGNDHQKRDQVRDRGANKDASPIHSSTIRTAHSYKETVEEDIECVQNV